MKISRKASIRAGIVCFLRRNLGAPKIALALLLRVIFCKITRAGFVSSSIVFLSLALDCRTAIAHPLDLAIVDLSLDSSSKSELSGVGTISLAPAYLGGDLAELSPPQRGERILELIGSFYLLPANNPCVVTLESRATQRVSELFGFKLSCRGNESQPTGIRIVKGQGVSQEREDGGGTVYFTSLNGKRHTFTLSAKNYELLIHFNNLGVFRELFLMGISHIGADLKEWYHAGSFVLPEGIDHILFVMTLVLVSPSFISLVKTVTGFTLGHAVSLTVVSLGGIAVSARLVEPAIAASIAVMALSAMRGAPLSRAWVPAALFGVLHGCGFASAFLERGLSSSELLVGLIAFNLGVESGQLIFVATFWVGLIWLANRIQARQVVVARVVATFIFIVSVYWFLERVF